ncbi:MAG: ABC transporter ATP-binding protein [Planctomycetota bacterium]
MIKVNNISHGYGEQSVLKDIELTIPAGELLAVMGANGAGKSTLLATIAGTIMPTLGHVEIDGVTRRSSVEGEIAIRKKIAYLPASPWMSRQIKVRKWLHLYGQLYDVPKRRLLQHTESLLQLFHLIEQADKSIQSCSTGQQKKVAICSALITDAPVLILDEPFTGGLDPSAIRALERVLKRLADKEDRTVVIASQIPELVEAVANRVAILSDNQIVGIGSLDEMRQTFGTDGPLGELFEQVVQPDPEDEVETYFKAEASS